MSTVTVAPEQTESTRIFRLLQSLCSERSNIVIPALDTIRADTEKGLRYVDHSFMDKIDLALANANPQIQQSALRTLATIIKKYDELPFYPDQGITIDTVRKSKMRAALVYCGASGNKNRYPQDPTVRVEAYRTFTVMAKKWPDLTGDADLWCPLRDVAFSPNAEKSDRIGALHALQQLLLNDQRGLGWDDALSLGRVATSSTDPEIQRAGIQAFLALRTTDKSLHASVMRELEQPGRPDPKATGDKHTPA